mmetsp:Transcript_39222/g.79968  ORF Transcript_39222/g.79968 Transcript_39222/m.79968 type:complete len:304 (-) Transcript_39222:170-1081(-)
MFLPKMIDAPNETSRSCGRRNGRFWWVVMLLAAGAVATALVLSLGSRGATASLSRVGGMSAVDDANGSFGVATTIMTPPSVGGVDNYPATPQVSVVVDDVNEDFGDGTKEPPSQEKRTTTTTTETPPVAGGVDNHPDAPRDFPTVESIHGTLKTKIYNPPDGTTETTCLEEGYGCVGDRMGHDERLDVGKAICSRKGQYVFGMDAGGSLIWRDCFEDESILLFQGEPGDYFVMEDDAAFTVRDVNGNVKWRKDSQVEVHDTGRCLYDPAFDCPYLHLHTGGVMVLNWIDGHWKSRNFKKLYDF